MDGWSWRCVIHFMAHLADGARGRSLCSTHIPLIIKFNTHYEAHDTPALIIMIIINITAPFIYLSGHDPIKQVLNRLICWKILINLSTGWWEVIRYGSGRCGY